MKTNKYDIKATVIRFHCLEIRLTLPSANRIDGDTVLLILNKTSPRHFPLDSHYLLEKLKAAGECWQHVWHLYPSAGPHPDLDAILRGFDIEAELILFWKGHKKTWPFEDRKRHAAA